MSDKQRADHIQEKYWNGFITRTEAQKVFDEQTQVIFRHAEVMAKFDAAISCIAEKVGLTPADVNNWIKVKTEEAAKKVEEGQATNASQNTEQEPSSLIVPA